MVSKQEAIQSMKDMYKNVFPIKVTDLFVDDNYQRSQSRKMVLKIKKDFDPALFGILKVAQRPGGKYAVVDGQHRLQAAKEMGLVMVICQVISAEESSRREAESFVECNTSSRGLTRLNILKSKVHAGDEVAVRMSEIASENGFVFSQSKKQFSLQCVYSCDQVMKKGEDIFASVLKTIGRAWGASGRSVDGRIVLGLGLFLWGAGKADGAEVNLNMLVEKLSIITPDSIIAGSGGETSKSKFWAVARCIQNIYNARLRKENKIDITKVTYAL